MECFGFYLLNFLFFLLFILRLLRFYSSSILFIKQFWPLLPTVHLSIYFANLNFIAIFEYFFCFEHLLAFYI